MAALSGLSFVYVLLPFMLAVFLLTPSDWRPASLLLLSLGYYLLAQPNYLVFMVSCVSMDWAALIVMERFDDSPPIRTGCLVFSVCKNLAGILWFWGMVRAGRILELPLGLKVVALSGLWCVLDVYRRGSPYPRGPVHLALYCMFFPRLHGGPLMPYKDFASRLKAPNPSPSSIGNGLLLYLQGAVAFGVLGSELTTLHHSLSSILEAEASVLGGWCMALVLALSFYYRLWGLALMAQGIGKMTGLFIPHNFYYPYQARGISDFFQRFNITVGRFLESAVPLPKTGRKAADIFRLLLLGLASGLWFGPWESYAVWGLYLGVFLILERYVYPRLLENTPTLFRRAYSLIVVLAGFPLLGAERLEPAYQIMAMMLGAAGVPFFNGRLGYLLASNWLLLAICILFASSGASLLLAFLKRRFPRGAAVLSGAATVFLLSVLTAFSL